MVVDRIERHDILNAVMLAGVLLLLGLGIVTAVQGLFSTVDDGIVVASKEPIGSEQAPAGADADSDTDSEDSAASEIPETTVTPAVPARPPEQVTVRVANGARRVGVAAAGTNVVIAAGYPTLEPKNGPTTDSSIVYYQSGFEADAARVAEILGVDDVRLEEMPADPGVPIEEANVIAIIGGNSDY